ncbi:uncharacterized protein LOC120214115 [Hibiscus syriacus]|uniref:uncharacterized protein LOC120214115 n=1 Tax=Hibiscus syriacus TaxID=106335 RepID=UPI0019249D2D|nr:uncharacterized protein LOC120214115 [Hibiscus syriacus]
MAKHLEEVITWSQSAFVKGISILDNTLVAQELVKGYGRTTLLLDILGSFEWGVVGYFEGARAIRQRDPLSPILFVLVTNVLSYILDAAASHGLFQFHPKCHRIKLIHFCFVDDLLIFSKGNYDYVMGIWIVLQEFYVYLGLAFNASKSEIFSTGIAREELQLIVEKDDQKAGHLPVRYLGIPLVTRKLSIADCKPLMDKIEDRFQTWAARHLSYAGRMQLIQAVIFSIQNYWSKQLVLPKKVVQRISQLCTRFFWKNYDFSTKGAQDGSSLVAWSYKYVMKGSDFWLVRPKVRWSWIWKRLVKLRVSIPNDILSDSDSIWGAVGNCLLEIGLFLLEVCVMFGADQETRNHVFLDFPFSREVWTLILRACDLERQVVDWEFELSWAFHRFKGKYVLSVLLKLTWNAMNYFVWRERNRRIFQGTRFCAGGCWPSAGCCSLEAIWEKH